MHLIDSHCHLDMLAADQLGQLLDNARQAGVRHFLSINVNPNNLADLDRLTCEHEDISLSVGLHPLHQQEAEISLPRLLELGQHPRVIAIGETGLDYYYGQDQADAQWHHFTLHLQAALQLNKPVIVHTRDAAADTLAALKPFCEAGGRGLIHCFTEDLAFAREVIGMGLYVSFSGIVTFRSADALREVARQVPLDRLLIETDAPYLAPVPYRGQTNQPAYVRQVAESIAQIRDLPVEQVAQQTSENFYRLFGFH